MIGRRAKTMIDVAPVTLDGPLDGASTSPPGGADALSRLQGFIGRHVTLLAWLGLLLCALSAAVTVRGGLAAHPWATASSRVLMIAVTLGVGLVLCRRGTHARFGALLVVGAGVLFLVGLAGSPNAVLYSISRVALFLVDPGIAFLILTFPTGRVTGAGDRRLLAAIALVLLTLYLPTVLLVDSYPAPAAFRCVGGCPGNAFQVTATEPELVGRFLIPLRELLAVLLIGAVVVVAVARTARASWLRRLTMTPVLSVAAARIAVLAALFVLRRAHADADVRAVVGWVYVLLVPALAAAFMVGLTRERSHAAAALGQLVLGLRGTPEPAALRSTMRDALRDPTLDLAYWMPAGEARWVTADGVPVQLPAADSGRSVTEVADDSGPVAAITHDEALDDQPVLLDATAALAGMALENQRLAAGVEASLRELKDSRSRMIEAADEERARIERDLHDGAQQQLLGLQVKLQLAADLLARDPAAGRGMLDEVAGETGAVLEEVRALARGVYPALLAQGGLGRALDAAALRAPFDVQVTAESIERYSPAIEKAVYFCCLEALQNATKHGGRVHRVQIHLSADDALRFEVRDDGAGFEVQPGLGLTSMRDRLAGVDGELEVESAPGAGTCIKGSVPM